MVLLQNYANFSALSESVKGRRWLQKASILSSIMGSIRYAVAGDPIEMSLSPLLFHLVSEHIGLKNATPPSIVPASTIENALAWGYAGVTPEEIEWYHTDAPLSKFRSKTLIEKAIQSLPEIESLPSSLAPKYRLNSQVLVGDHRHLHYFEDEEIWMNLTTPLKHQLQTMAVTNVDDSASFQSVNSLRWDGQGWLCMSTDGVGMTTVLLHRGIPSASCVGVIGGGSAARSFAHAWIQQGGQIHFIGGKREFDTDEIDLSSSHPEAIAVFEPHDFTLEPVPTFHAQYDVHIDLDLVLEPTDAHYDGRWLLVAQHLKAWEYLWAPHQSADLPSVELLLKQLIECEKVLRSFKR
jgi:shikimate 5-dehydrogenase